MKPQVNSEFNFDVACALRMKWAKDSSIVVNISRDIIVKVEEIDDDTKKMNRMFLSLNQQLLYVLLCLLAL